MLKDYLNLPEEVPGLGYIYPVSIMEWETFSQCARTYLLYSYDFLKYRCELDESVKLLDFIMALILQEKSEEEGVQSLKQFVQMLSLTFREPVKSFFHTSSQSWVFLIGEEKDARYLTRDNFDLYRDVVMRQNLLFEPLVAPNEFSQKTIDDAILKMSRRAPETDLESMLALVSVVKGVSPEALQTYSYYQLRADYEISQRVEYNRFIHLYRSQGAKAEPLNLSAKLEMLENPYSFEKLFKKVDAVKESSFQKMLS